ncbi:MAG: class I SAM-dependent methyltransferase [Ignavibacteriaceae bacterium]|nr:class I SAM-dependent methyltransferase [Ignavibacteriaceae bacterium]
MKLWFEEWFESEEYLTVYKHRNNEEAEVLISFILSKVSLTGDAKVLDLGCGAGRHALLLAKMGFQVTGVDQSAKLLSVAVDEAKKNGLCAKFIRDDIRTVTFPEKFDLILNVFTSFGYFENDEDNFAVFVNVEKLLSEDGVFVFDFLNAEYVKRNLVPFSKDVLDDMVIEQSRKIEGNNVIKEIELLQNGNRKNYRESVRLYSKRELINALDKTNLSTEMIFGNYTGEIFDEKSSSRLILVCKKKK